MREFIVTVIGLLAAALSAGVVFAVVAVVGGNPVAEVPVVTFLAFGFSLLPAFVFGGILFVVFRSFHLVRWWSAALGGITVGALISTLFASETSEYWQSIALCLLTGAAAGLVFWVVWKGGMRHKAPHVENASSNDVPSA